MGRRAGYILLVLAGFLLVTGAASKWYVYPRLAVAPLDQDSLTVLFGPDITYFSKATLTEQVDDLTINLKTVGDVDAAKSYGHDVAVWSQGTTTVTSDGTTIDTLEQVTPFDRKSAEAVDCCNATFAGRPFTFSGLIYKWPFNSQKHDYQFFANDSKQTVTFHFDGTETIDGLRCYRYVSDFGPTQIGTQSVPSRLVGAKPGEMLTLPEYTTNHRVFHIEPETGVIIKAEENPDTVLRYQGEDALTITKGHAEYDTKTVQGNVDDYKGKATQLHLIRVVVPIVGLVVGLLCLIVGLGVLLLDLRRSRRPTPEPAPVEPVGS
ncbi:MAG TPA: DUF3068 domain-containing protein [Nocardioides sp.]|jgi:hypothetical protein|nr:DUF3068 domain-containing protein [Nocardioides sp.]